jgi:DNA replication and repair protein RecF
MAMRIARLALTDFRNHADLLLEVGPGLVVLTGENGVGKTNVLEAISLLAPGRGLRNATLGEMARTDGPGGFAVAARLTSSPSLASYSPLPRAGGGERSEPDSSQSGIEPDRLLTLHPIPSRRREGRDSEIDIGTGTTPAAPERRQVRINGATAAANSLAEWLSVLWLTPAMDRLFSDTAGARRRFLDRFVLALEPGHAAHAARYEAAMRARNKLLADPAPPDPAWLASLEAAMADHGSLVAAARQRTVAALAARLAQGPDGLFPRAAVALDQPMLSETELRERLAAARERDAAAGRALIGPHRADLMVTHVDKGQPADRCSTGEQKALLLSLVLAHAGLVADRAGRAPLLLLDEVAAHLDSRRRAALFVQLRDWGGQVWMTGTDAALFEAVGRDATRLDLSPRTER